MSSWRRCESCRKVKPVSDFDGEATTCQACVAGPPAPVRKTKPAPVRVSMAPPQPAVRRGPAPGAVGSGDFEARERRAKRTAWEQLAELHAEEYEQLLQVARRAEGLRS